jgi:hypothetical protein
MTATDPLPAQPPGAQMTASTVNFTSIAAPLLRTGMTTISGAARNVRTEQVHGRPHICWSDDTPESRLAPLDAVVLVTLGSVIRPMLLATRQVNGGTRVIALIASRRRGGDTVVTVTAYDSNHPGDDRVVLVAGGPGREELISQARETAASLFRPLAEDEPCGCWARWDPYCGSRGCWGSYDSIVPATVTFNS